MLMEEEARFGCILSFRFGEQVTREGISIDTVCSYNRQRHPRRGRLGEAALGVHIGTVDSEPQVIFAHALIVMMTVTAFML
jgi:hypothetical protein